LIPALASLLGGIASVLTFWSAEEVSNVENGRGALTGPFILLALLGSMLLAVGAIVQLWRPRTGIAASLLGLALTSPFFSWLFAAGAWCSALGGCYGEYPIFRFDPYSAACVALALVSIALQSTPRRS
jgi:hypothetical protein